MLCMMMVHAVAVSADVVVKAVAAFVVAMCYCRANILKFCKALTL